MLLFDTENECCFCPSGRLVFTEPAVCAQDHTAMEPGTLGPEIIRYKGSVRLNFRPPHTPPHRPRDPPLLPLQDYFSPITPADRQMHQLCSFSEADM